MSDINSQIIDVIKSIPYGKVMTYGQVAEIVGIKDARTVGMAISGNKNSDIPCHRLVKADGGLAINYTKGDWKNDKFKLIQEGIEFLDDTHVNLKKFQYEI